MKRIFKNNLKDESGVSSFITFLFVVFPLIVLIFAILEIANLSNTMISMNRGLHEASYKTATSSLPMTNINERWKNNFLLYLVSQGNSRTQFSNNINTLELVTVLPNDSGTKTGKIYTKITVGLDYTMSPAASRATLQSNNIIVENTSGGPPTIKVEIKYRYKYIGPFLSYLLMDNIDSIVLGSGLKIINEHPNYDF